MRIEPDICLQLDISVSSYGEDGFESSYLARQQGSSKSAGQSMARRLAGFQVGASLLPEHPLRAFSTPRARPKYRSLVAVSTKFVAMFQEGKVGPRLELCHWLTANHRRSHGSEIFWMKVAQS